MSSNRCGAINRVIPTFDEQGQSILNQVDEMGHLTNMTQTGSALTNTPSFDAAGNTTQLVVSVLGQTFTTQYLYDHGNRLLAVARLRNGTQGESVTTSVTQLEYDGQGLLLRVTDNGSVRRLVRDRVDQLARPLVETDASGSAVRWFVWANGSLLAQVGTNSVIRVAHFDELGRLLAFTDNSGVQTDEFAYQPYGRLIAHSGTTDTPFTWLGAYGVWHVGKGLYLTRCRGYDSNLMRFVQADPIGLQGGYNLYAYAEGNPLHYADPSGLYAGVDDAIFAGGGALVGLIGQGIGDALSGTVSGWQDYTGAAIGGAAGGEALLYTGPIGAGAIGGAVTSVSRQGFSAFTGTHSQFSGTALLMDTGIGAATGLIPGVRIPGITAGRNSYNAIYRQMTTRFENGTISRVTLSTAIRMFMGRAVDTSLLPGAGAGAVAGWGLSGGVTSDSQFLCK